MKVTNTAIALFITLFALLFGGVCTQVGMHTIGVVLLVIGGIFAVCSGVSYLDSEEEKMIQNRKYY